MSTTQGRLVLGDAPAAQATPEPVFEELAGREVPLGGVRAMLVRRTLPHRTRRTVGAWCFVDHFGAAGGGARMHVPPHPHIGLQTVSWLFEGVIRHRDSLGSDQVVQPGTLSLMTAGAGIAHAEDSVPPDTGGPRGGPGGGPRDGAGGLHGLQLWVALPAGARAVAPSFEHHAQLPSATSAAVTATVVVGDLLGESSPASTHSPLVAAQLRLSGGPVTLGLRPSFEHAVLAVDGDVVVEGRRVAAQTLVYLGRSRRDIELSGDGRAFLIGGEPFTDPLVMWWNFVAGDHDEVAGARADWEGGRRFGPVPDYGPQRLAAPPMPTTRLLPR